MPECQVEKEKKRREEKTYAGLYPTGWAFGRSFDGRNGHWNHGSRYVLFEASQVTEAEHHLCKHLSFGQPSIVHQIVRILEEMGASKFYRLRRRRDLPR